jgi:hypothetical protein
MKCIDGICTKKILNDIDIHYVIKSDNTNKKINTFMEYVFEIINCTLQNEELIETEYTVNIKCTEEYNNKFNFNNIKYSDKIKLFYTGLKQAKSKLENKTTKMIIEQETMEPETTEQETMEPETTEQETTEQETTEQETTEQETNNNIIIKVNKFTQTD